MKNKKMLAVLSILCVLTLAFSTAFAAGTKEKNGLPNGMTNGMVDGMKNGKVNGDKPQDQTDEQPDSQPDMKPNDQPDAKPAEPSDEQPDQTKDASNAPMDAALAKQLYSDGSLTQEQYNALTEALDGQSAATLQTLLDGNYISQELYDVLIAALQK